MIPSITPSPGSWKRIGALMMSSNISIILMKGIEKTNNNNKQNIQSCRYAEVSTKATNATHWSSYIVVLKCYLYKCLCNLINCKCLAFIVISSLMLPVRCSVISVAKSSIHGHMNVLILTNRTKNAIDIGMNASISRNSVRRARPNVSGWRVLIGILCKATRSNYLNHVW